jgi:hypothetical protein
MKCQHSVLEEELDMKNKVRGIARNQKTVAIVLAKTRMSTSCVPTRRPVASAAIIGAGRLNDRVYCVDDCVEARWRSHGEMGSEVT